MGVAIGIGLFILIIVLISSTKKGNKEKDLRIEKLEKELNN